MVGLQENVAFRLNDVFGKEHLFMLMQYCLRILDTSKAAEQVEVRPKLVSHEIGLAVENAAL